MSKFYCPKCSRSFEMPYWKWILTNPFHMFFKRKTKCPLCGERSWMARVFE